MVYNQVTPKTSQAGVLKNSGACIIGPASSSIGTAICEEISARTKTTIASLFPLPASANLLTVTPKRGRNNAFPIFS